MSRPAAASSATDAVTPRPRRSASLMAMPLRKTTSARTGSSAPSSGSGAMAACRLSDP